MEFSRHRVDIINPNGLYSKRALMSIGISRAEAIEAEKAGMPKHLLGQTHWYLGSDLIVWIKEKNSTDSE